MGTTPYSQLPQNRFWRSGVAESDPKTITDLYKKKFGISPSDRIATAGSCFAQHISQHLRARGFSVLDVEPPIGGMSFANAQNFGFLTYSGRYGNIYTVRQLLQLVRDAMSATARSEDVWEKDSRYFDALRPSVEPFGLPSPEEVTRHRLRHLDRVKYLLRSSDLFVFTLGLTEAWVHRKTGTVYPICPGVIAGSFDPDLHAFHNFEYPEIYSDLAEVRLILKRINPDMRFLFTVSPVPLTATACDQHVLVSTTWSKSTLRAVCGAIEREFPDVDYFPSYELIATPFSRGAFYAENMRSVTKAGVDAVMRVFFLEHDPDDRLIEQHQVAAPKETAIPSSSVEDDLVCEEKLLEAFAQ